MHVNSWFPMRLDKQKADGFVKDCSSVSNALQKLQEVYVSGLVIVENIFNWQSHEQRLLSELSNALHPRLLFISFKNGFCFTGFHR